MDRTRRKPITAGELLAKLAADPDYQTRRRQFEQARMDRVAALRLLEEPVLAELRAAGFRVSSIRGLADAKGKVEAAALPILLQHLQLPHPPDVRIAIGHVMAAGDCRFAWRNLLALFKAETDRTENGVQWAIGCALAKAAHKEVIPDLIELLEDRQHGENRVIFFRPLMRSRNPRARAALEAARQDPQLGSEVTKLLDRSLRRQAVRLSKWKD